jgi:hypothetical protein
MIQILGPDKSGVRMTEQEFFHWLKGYLEVSACTSIGEVQTAIIKDKLQSVFVKETKNVSGGGGVVSSFGTYGGATTIGYGTSLVQPQQIHTT